MTEVINHGVRRRNPIRALFLVAALSAVQITGHAASTFPGFMAQVAGRSTTVGMASNGIPIVTKGTGLTSGSGWVSAGNYGVAPGAVAGSVKIGGSGTIPVAGKGVPAQIQGSIDKGAIAGAIAACATGGIVGCALGLGVPLAIGFIDGTGKLRWNEGKKYIEVARDGNCSPTECWEFLAEDETWNSGWMKSPSSACAALGGHMGSVNGTTYKMEVTGTVPGYMCKFAGSGDMAWHFGDLPLANRSAPYSSSTWYPATPVEIKDALIKTGPPKPLMVPELEKAGIDWAKVPPSTGYASSDGTMDRPKIIGPTKIDGEKTTTTNPDGSRTTTQSSTPLTYDGPKVTAGPTTSTQIKTNTDGSPGGTTTTVTEAGTEQPAPTEEKPPVDPCDEHPERIGCLEADTPEGEIPKSSKNITFDIQDEFGAGACPANLSMGFSAAPGIGSKTVVDWASTCELAIPMRAIVMALASIMAFFIVLPGGARIE